MNTYIWSASRAGFFPVAEKALFTAAGQWPDDGIGVSAEEHDALFPVPEGRVIGSVKGRPQWVAIPPPTEEEVRAAAANKKDTLILNARNKISLWQTGLQLGLISEEDKASLIVWMNYIQTLDALDTTLAPDIEWPPLPE